jgi:hypothetical protein
VFSRLLLTSLSDYVVQLEEYIRFTKADLSTVLISWKSLEAYRATVPLSAPAVYRDLFILNIQIALVILSDSVSPTLTDYAGCV